MLFKDVLVGNIFLMSTSSAFFTVLTAEPADPARVTIQNKAKSLQKQSVEFHATFHNLELVGKRQCTT